MEAPGTVASGKPWVFPDLFLPGSRGSSQGRGDTREAPAGRAMPSPTGASEALQRRMVYVVQTIGSES